MTRKEVSPYRCRKFSGSLMLLLGLLAIPPRVIPQHLSKQSQASQPHSAGVRPDSTVISIGNIIMWVYADGKTARDPVLGEGARFPDYFNGGPIIYQDGVQWAGLVRDGADTLLRADGQSYEVGTQPGRILSPGRAENPVDPNVNRIWRIRRDYLSLQDQFGELQREAAILTGKNWFEVTAEEANEVFDRNQRDWNEWPWQKGAPFYDTGVDARFDEDEAGYDALTNPDPHQDNFPLGSEADGIKQTEEEPGIAGADQVVWFVCNDVDDRVTRQLAASPPIGLEMQATLWAYRRRDLGLSNLIFKRYLITYKGLANTTANARIDSMYLAQWSDPDIGEFNDDLIGCDPGVDLGYAYNADGDDRFFSSLNISPPAAGYVLLSGPLVPEPGRTAFFGLRKKEGFRNLPMTGFNSLTGSSVIDDPCRCYQLTLGLWNLIRGFQKSPTYPPEPWRDPDGNPTPFVYSGDPSRGQGWTDDARPGDRRFLLSSGPFSMALGDTNEIVLAVAAGHSATNLSSINSLKSYAHVAKTGMQNLFALPEPPATPKLTATALDGKVLLNWGDDQETVRRTENLTPAGYEFEGYNLYELTPRQASLSEGEKIATFDRINDVRTIIDEVIDPATGLLSPRIVQTGNNTGIQYSMVVSRSRLEEFYPPLVNGREYAFALTAYHYNPDQPFGIASLESEPSIVTVAPQTLKPGVRWQSGMGDTLAVAHPRGNGEGRVVAVVVDPSKLTGDEYHVTFGHNSLNQTVWNLRNHTKDIDLLTGMANQAGGADYLIVDGVQTIVIDSVGVKGWSLPTGRRFWSWAGGDGFQLEGFGGAMGWGGSYPYNPSNLPASEMVDVLFILTETDGDGNPANPSDPNYSYAYRFLQNAQAPPAKPEFAPHIVNTGGDFVFQDFKKSVPWAAYEYDRASGQIGRRLSIGFLENNVPAGRVDGKWWPPDTGEIISNTDAQGPREWFWIFYKEYSETPDELLASPASSMSSTVAKPILLWGTVTRRSTEPVRGNNRFAISVHRPNGPDDEFVFRTTAPVYDNTLAKNDVLQLVTVYPNPYNGHLADELDLNQRWVTFSHLPAKATIRIFNLGGQLVAVIRKDDDSQFAKWNLLNQTGRLAASGMYIAHIEMPDVGASKVLKLAIIQP